MSLTTQQYLALSSLAYHNFDWPSDQGKTIDWLLDNRTIVGEGTAVLSGLSLISDWTLVNYESHPNSTGFAGLAFQAPDGPNGEPGEIVFAFRGTEPFTNGFVNGLNDIDEDLNIAFGEETHGPTQFDDAFDFWSDTLQYVGTGNYDGYSFTGHSLGGGLAQYMTYSTNEAGHATTFNAVGIGQVLDGVNPSDYNDSITDYVNENDIIGMYGVQLGTTVYMQDFGGQFVNLAMDLFQEALKVAALKALGQGKISQAAAFAILNGVTEIGQAVGNGFNDLLTGAHGLDTYFDVFGNFTTAVSGPNLAIYGLTKAFQGGFTITESVVDGVQFILLELPTVTGEAVAKVSIGIIEGGAEVVITIGETVYNWASFIGESALDVIYSIATAAGQFTDTVGEMAILLFKTVFGEYMPVNGTASDDTLSNILNISTVFSGLGGNDIINGTSNKDLLKGGSGDDTLYGNDGTDYIYGEDGNDILVGGSGLDALFGGAGNDILYGGDVNNLESYLSAADVADILDGGAGDDMLQGGSGGDTYIFGKGYGHDIIYDTASGYFDEIIGLYPDVIKFLADVEPSDVAVHRRNNYDLEFKIISTGDTITVQDFFSNKVIYGFNSHLYQYGIEHVIFADSTDWNLETLEQKARIITEATRQGDNPLTLKGYDDQNDSIYGSSSSNSLWGYDGNDVLYGGAGNDDMYGGKGNDILYGGDGDDILYAYEVISQFNNPTGGGADILDGGTGNDYLYGDGGSTTYIFGRGYGQDIIQDLGYLAYGHNENERTNGGVDKIVFNSDTSPNDVAMVRKGDNLEITINGTTDKLTVINQFTRHPYPNNSEIYAIETIQFSNGTIWDMSDIHHKATYIGTSGNDQMNGSVNTGQVFEAGAGNDTVIAGNGNDFITGGTGNDTLEGRAGNDTYYFNLGDGIDTIYDVDTNIGNVDTIAMLDSINPADVEVIRQGENLELRIKNTTDKIIIEKFFSTHSKYDYSDVGMNGNRIEQVTFTDSTIWDLTTLLSKASHINGTASDDSLIGFNDQQNIISAGDGNDTVYAGILGDTIYGEAGDDIIYGADGGDTIYGGTGNDVITAGNGTNYIHAGADNDEVYGGTGIDYIYGEAGDDLLEGKEGADTYYFNLGDGADTIYDFDYNTSNIDRVIFGAGIDPADVVASRVEDDLVLTIIGTTDKVTIERYFSVYGRMVSDYNPYVGLGTQKVEEIVFADNTIWDIQTILDKTRYINGTSGNDTLNGYDIDDIISGLGGNDTIHAGDGNDEVYGGAGNDVLYGDGGNDLLDGGDGDDILFGGDGADILDGGAGDDLLEGGYGADTYRFNIGSGNDTIYDSNGYYEEQDRILFGSAISEGDVTLQRVGDDLIFNFLGSTDTLTVEKYFSQYGRTEEWGDPFVGINGNKIELIEFDNGIIWDNEKVIEKVALVLGTPGNDTLVGVAGRQNKLSGLDGDDVLTAASIGDYLDGGDGDDILNGGDGQDVLKGGTGNDTLKGGEGKDIYLFAPGDGHDTIYDGDGTYAMDTISFQEGISPEDVEFSRSGFDLVLTINGGVTDSITIQDYFSNVLHGSIEEHWVGVNKIEEIRFADNTILDMWWIEYQLRNISGTVNADTIVGYETDDTINALEGNDTVYGGGGNDVINGNDGDDILYGEIGDDQMNGGTCDDVLVGGEGSDTYIFEPSSGADEIQDFSTNVGEIDTIAFQYGISPGDVTITKNGDDLVFTIVNSTDSLTVKNYFSPYKDNTDPTDYGIGVNKIERVTFADNTTWSTRIIEYAVEHGGVVDPSIIFLTEQDDYFFASGNGQTIFADAGNDQIWGSWGDDSLYGEDGNDTISASGGNDLLVGGAGDDTLGGDEGDDTYVFAPGFGHDQITDYDTTTGNIDTIAFSSGIDPQDVTLSRHGDNLVLTVTEDDSITVQGYFTAGGYQKVEKVLFADNTIWDTTTLDAATPYFNIVTGTQYNDTLYGAMQEMNIISGDEGDDSLYGGYSDDTYIFNGSFGNDHILDYYGNDRAEFNISKDSLIFTQVGNNLEISSGGASDTVTVDNWYQQWGSYKIETIEASDGSTITNSQIEQLIQAMASWSSNNNGMSWSQALISNPQDVQNIVSQHWTAPTV